MKDVFCNFCFYCFIHSSFTPAPILLSTPSHLPFQSFTLSPATTLCSMHQSTEPKGSESQPTPVTNKETLGSHLTAERLGGSVQVLLAHAAAWLCFLSLPVCLSLCGPFWLWFFMFCSFCVLPLLSFTRKVSIDSRTSSPCLSNNKQTS